MILPPGQGSTLKLENVLFAEGSNTWIARQPAVMSGAAEATVESLCLPSLSHATGRDGCIFFRSGE